MKILSFDQASITSGYAVFKDGQYALSGTIKKSQHTPIDARIQEMAKSICMKIKEEIPDIVVIEDIQDQKNISTVISLARLQGAIMFYCNNKNIRIEILKPSQWRSALHYKQGAKVKREALKQQSFDYVKTQLGLNIESEDENEAVAIGAAACIFYDNNSK